MIVLKTANSRGLRRMIGKMFDDFEIMGCCDDPASQGQSKARHASAREQGSKT
jgi:hypothetical protein